MAAKIERQDEGLHDLEILHPHADITVAGRQLTVREYGFVEGLRLRAKMQPFLESLRSLTAKPEITPIERILDILAEHEDTVLDLVTASAGVDRDWVVSLNDQDGTMLMFTWWRVNSPFFVRQLQNRMISELLQPLPNANPQPDGATSTPPSSPTDTTPSASASTPSVK